LTARAIVLPQKTAAKPLNHAYSAILSLRINILRRSDTVMALVNSCILSPEFRSLLAINNARSLESKNFVQLVNNEFQKPEYPIFLAPEDISRRELLRLALGASAVPFGGTITAAPSILRRPIPRTKGSLPVIGLITWQIFDVGRGSEAGGRPGDIA
jgi:hypothetical protein